jgi:hypothetical protein
MGANRLARSSQLKTSNQAHVEAGACPFPGRDRFLQSWRNAKFPISCTLQYLRSKMRMKQMKKAVISGRAMIIRRPIGDGNWLAIGKPDEQRRLKDVITPDSLTTTFVHEGSTEIRRREFPPVPLFLLRALLIPSSVRQNPSRSGTAP